MPRFKLSVNLFFENFEWKGTVLEQCVLELPLIEFVSQHPRYEKEPAFRIDVPKHAAKGG